MISSYIRQIREKIGHDFLVLPSVTILVFDAQKRVLLVRHHNNNVWVAPGGMIEPDEMPEEAAVREMQEETCCNVRLIQTLGTYGGAQFRIRYQDGDEVGYVMTVYEAEIIEGEPKPDGQEILATQYFSYEQTKELNTGRWVPTVLRDVYENKLSKAKHTSAAESK
ncbi:MAG TPA: NUDIX domain-containing protein [Flavisolibacter sp.]|nr:NUDIX domain-containing protein [Flavisolibacter sp.]